MRLTPTNHHNPCPICQDTTGDCRISDIILCHDFIDTDSGVGGWKWLKPSSNGVWGVHVPDNGKEYNRSQRDRYLAQKQAQQKNKQQFLADNALDKSGRDKAIRKLSRHVGLDSGDCKDLRSRGLSESQIEAGLFFSIDPWTRFNLNLPDNLPGIHFLGDRFATKDTGYACPIFDKDGLVIGWQLRLEGVTKGNKYKWAKGNFSSHLPNGELPITIVKPNPKNPSKTLYLSEGILKAYIASHLHNITVCGAAGGYFRGSPQQLASIIADYNEIVIVPDAGDVLNSQVMRRWEQQINYLKRFNKPIKVLWWGQVSKDSHQDIDEIEQITFSNAEYLSPKEFFDLAKKELYIQQQWHNWKNYKKFTSSLKINQKFIEYGLPLSNTIALIKSALATGKTTQVINHLSQLQKYGIIGLGYRNTLLLQFNEKAKKIGFYHLQSDKNLREFSLDDPGVKVTNCIESLIHYSPEQFDGKIIILDEVISVLKTLLFSSTVKQFSKVKKLFTEMANRCDRMICLDGFMQDWAVTFFKEICPQKEIVTIENIYQGDKAQTYLLEGTIDINEKLRANDKTPWLKKLLNSDCPVVTADSQIMCEALENLFLEQGRTGIRGDGKTTSEKHVKEFFRDPDKWIVENHPEYVILSPSAESGLDISVKNYFSEHFAFFFGMLDIDSIIQMLGRVRDTDVPKYVWCKKFILPEDINRRPSNVEALQADRARNLMRELNSTLNKIESPEAKIARIQQIYQDNLDPYTTAADTIVAIRNHEFANYRECFKRQLISNGYPVEAVTLESLDNRKAIAKQESSAKTEVKKQNSRDIYQASDKYIGQAKTLLNFDANWETRCAVMKALLISQLPGINQDNVWSPDFIKLVKYDKPNLIKQTELYYLMDNPDVAKQLAVEKYNKIFNRGSIPAPWKLRQDYLKVKTLIDIGLYDFIQKRIDNPDLPYQADSPEVKTILDKCRQRKNRDVLGTPHLDPIKFVNKLLRSTGMETKSKKVKQDGKTVSVYYLDQKHLLSESRLAILQAIQLKYEQIINSKNPPLSWVDFEENSPQNSPIESSASKMAETLVKPELESVAFDPQIDINNSTNCNHHSNHQSLDNLPPEINNTNSIQEPMDSEEAIADLAWMLERIEDAEGLAELTRYEGFTPTQLNRAARRLLPIQRQRLRQWAIQNQQRKSTA